VSRLSLPPGSRASDVRLTGIRTCVYPGGLPATMTLGMTARITSLWAAIQGDAVFMRRINGWLTMFWLVMIPISLAMGWVKSVTYVSALSLWALVSGHWSAWQAARVEVAQQRELERQQTDPVEQKVVDRLVHTTTVEAVEEAPR
jgi:hypothetical protein